MSSSREDGGELGRVLRAVAAARRPSTGDHPTQPELLGYHEGVLPPAETDRLRAHLAACPACARALLALLRDLESFPEVEPADRAQRLSAAGVESAWRRFRERSGAAADRVHEPTPPLWPRPIARLAAGVLLALAAGLLGALLTFTFTSSRQERAPRHNVEIAELRPSEDVERGSVPSLRRPRATAEGLVLVLPLPAGERSAGYEVELRPLLERGAEPLLRIRDLVPTAAGSLTVDLPPARLPPAGVYRFEVFGVTGSRREAVAVYPLRLAEE